MHYLVMEFVDGLDLARVVERHGRLPVPDACEAIRSPATATQRRSSGRLSGVSNAKQSSIATSAPSIRSESSTRPTSRAKRRLQRLFGAFKRSTSTGCDGGRSSSERP